MGAFSRLTVARSMHRASDVSHNLIVHSLVGVAVFMALWALVAVLLGSQNDVAQGFGYFVLVVVILLTAWPLMTGVGAAILTRFGFRPYIRFRR